jgi:hypothetical protein
MTDKPKKYTKKQRAEILRDFVYYMGYYASVGLGECVGDMVELAENWSYAHRRGNGELTGKEQDRHIDAAFEKIANFSDHIGKKKRAKQQLENT